MQEVSRNRCFGGEQIRLQHHSDVLGCDMHFSVFLPPQARLEKVPQIFWLSGLTCTDENFVQKAGAQQFAAESGVALIAPDTSPRGDHVPDDPDDAWDFGKGAGFYVDATEAPWASHYNMYSYITHELPALIDANYSVLPEKRGIMGHSMGGHGAIVIGLRNPDKFRSISAFAPICAPTQCPWGQKALPMYLGENPEAWRDYDSVALIEQAKTRTPLWVDQGNADNFLEEQLRPDLLEQICNQTGHSLKLRRHDGYDHSYFFIASYIRDHIRWHNNQLNSDD